MGLNALKDDMQIMKAEISEMKTDIRLVMPMYLKMTAERYNVWDTPSKAMSGSGQSKSQKNKDATSSNTSDIYIDE